jgi:hypothetical protein
VADYFKNKSLGERGPALIKKYKLLAILIYSLKKYEITWVYIAN